MPDRRPLSSGRLLWARSRARTGLLASATATIAAAVATVCALLASLARAVASAGTPAPPGVPPEQVAAQVAAGTTALLSAAPALLLLVAILAATATAQLGRLLAAAREHEWATVRARGLSYRQAWTTDAAESAVVAIAGALAGLAVAALLLWIAGGSPSDAFAQAIAALAMAFLLAVVLTVSLRRGAEQRGAGRGARATTGALVVVVVLAAALVVWQLPQARPTGFDPIVAIAPAVLLLSGALVALTVFGALAGLAATPAFGGRSLIPAYPVRQVARRLTIYAVAVLLVALTVAQAVFAAAYSSTWTAAATDSAAVRAGADLRVDLDPQTASPADVADAAAVTGVDAASPALVAGAEFGSTTAELIAVPAAAIPTVVSTAGGLIDTDALAAAVTPAEDSVVAEPLPLGDAATGLRVAAGIESTGPNVVGSLELRAIVLDATGASAQLRLAGEAVRDEQGALSITGESDLPQGTAPWSLQSISAFIGPTNASGQVLLELTSVQAIGGSTLDATGEGQLTGNGRESVLWLADGGATAGTGAQLEGDAAEAAAAQLPPVRVAVTEALAERLGLGLGDTLDFRYAGTGRRGAIEVGGIEAAIPGAATTLAVFAPLDVLQVSMLQRGTSIVAPSSVWATGATSADDALSAALGGRPVKTASPGVTADVVGALVPGWWIATAGSAVLALVAAFAIVQTLALARRRELGVLRALGVTRGRQARMRAAELAAVLGAALVLGALAGALVAWLVASELVRAVTPGILPLGGGVTFAWAPLGAALAALVVGLALIVTSAALGVRRAARTATVGEESR
ncbi:ABC transporter permease [Microbacterium sp. 4R-513]|uniref:FtsX-like permease family protein n=1 Tax=Microbacterium sp. 4R-513 TaxID=2567934 RepID=UPI0013E2050A|nr:ABC transporter permease [Microbacterium sp. 4R-513]QIG39235.1 ABC transporter permease [Microbacterium sp. 4R-513]